MISFLKQQIKHNSLIFVRFRSWIYFFFDRSVSLDLFLRAVIDFFYCKTPWLLVFIKFANLYVWWGNIVLARAGLRLNYIAQIIEVWNFDFWPFWFLHECFWFVSERGLQKWITEVRRLLDFDGFLSLVVDGVCHTRGLTIEQTCVKSLLKLFSVFRVWAFTLTAPFAL